MILIHLIADCERIKRSLQRVTKMHDSFIQIISHVFVFNDLCHTQTAVPISNSSGDLRASSEREDKSSSRAVLTRALYLSSNLALPREMEREREGNISSRLSPSM